MSSVEHKTLNNEDKRNAARLTASAQDPITIHDDLVEKNNISEKRPS